MRLSSFGWVFSKPIQKAITGLASWLVLGFFPLGQARYIGLGFTTFSVKWEKEGDDGLDGDVGMHTHNGGVQNEMKWEIRGKGWRGAARLEIGEV